MAQYEPSRILENSLASENVQQYVEIGANLFLGTKDGMKYTLIPSSDNKLTLCEVLSETSSSLNSSKSSWDTSLQEEGTVGPMAAALNAYKGIKCVRKEDTPCRGQGDGSGNSFILTPDSALLLKNADNSIPGKVPALLEENQIQLGETSLTYTTLVPKQEKVEDVPPVNCSFSQPTVFQVPRSQITPVRQARGRNRQRMPFVNAAISPYPACRAIRHSTPRGQRRQRRPRQVFIEYRTPVLMPSTATISNSSISSGSSHLSLNATRDSSISSCNESLEYPRVPNNTPTSEGEGLGDQGKVMDLQQWIPEIHSRIEDYALMDSKESHNEKERKRRLRIKNACQEMKGLLPCVYDKTDNATVFENAVHFISFMRERIACDYDMEFLQWSNTVTY